MPVIYRVLPIDERGHREKSDQPYAMPGKEIAERKAQKPTGIQFVSIKRQHDNQGEERHDAREHLPLGVTPVRLAFVDFDQCHRATSPSPLAALEVRAIPWSQTLPRGLVAL